jgi:hypothetical protein
MGSPITLPCRKRLLSPIDGPGRENKMGSMGASEQDLKQPIGEALHANHAQWQFTLRDLLIGTAMFAAVLGATKWLGPLGAGLSLGISRFWLAWFALALPPPENPANSGAAATLTPTLSQPRRAQTRQPRKRPGKRA